MDYPINLERDGDGYLVTFPDVPEAITDGATPAEARENAADALAVALSVYIQERRDIPEPSPLDGRIPVGLNLLGTLKVALYRAMRARGWRKADLARAMDVNAKLVDRLLDLRHASTVGQLDAALEACGTRLEVETRALEVA